MANMKADEWASWEVDPSTRTAVHPFTKYAPVADTLSTTAADVFTVDRGIPSVNLVTNPRIESADITMFTNDNATSTARSTASVGQLGAASLLVPPSGSVDDGFYWATQPLTGHPEGSFIVASCEVKKAAGAGSETVKINITDSAGTEIVTSAAHTLTTTFTKISVIYSLPMHSPATYRVGVRAADTGTQAFHVDKIHIEHRKDGTVPLYVDGAVAPINGEQYEWLGTANASESRRRAGIAAIRGVRITNEHATIKVYIAFDDTASATTGIPIGGGETWETSWPVDFRTNISAIAASGTPAIHGVVWGIHQG